MSHSPSRHKVEQHNRRMLAEAAANHAQASSALVASAKGVVAAWNARIRDKVAAEFYPTIGTAIASGHYKLNYWCPACQQVGEVDLRTVADAHHPRAPISVLIPKLSCKNCCPNAPLAVLLDLVPPGGEQIYSAVALIDFPEGLVRIICGRCNRQGQYQKTTLLERYGPRIVGPDLLRKIADCDRKDSMNHPCGAHYDK